MARLLLMHGRKDPNQDMDDWGFEGPLLTGVEAVHVTYKSNITVYFSSKTAFERAKLATGWEAWDERCLEIKFHDDMLVTKGGYFGDWEFQTRRPRIN